MCQNLTLMRGLADEIKLGVATATALTRLTGLAAQKGLLFAFAHLGTCLKRGCLLYRHALLSEALHY